MEEAGNSRGVASSTYDVDFVINNQADTGCAARDFVFELGV